jgi:hypothetical protein
MQPKRSNLSPACSTGLLEMARMASKSQGSPARPPHCNKTVFLSHLYIKTNILPRQARDEHRENSKKRPFFSYLRVRAVHCGAMLEEHTHLSLFECFPYVCPEPVLVKRSFLDSFKRHPRKRCVFFFFCLWQGGVEVLRFMF